MRYERFVDELFDEFDEFDQDGAVDFADLYENELYDEVYDQYVQLPDERFHVCRRGCTRSPRQFPFNTVCQINVAGGGFGSGALIAPQVVLTAKHVLTSGGTFSCGSLSGNWLPYSSVNIVVGRDGTTTAARPTSIIVPSSRIRTHPSLDVGVAILPRAVQRPTRFMSLQWRPDSQIKGALLTLAGYPGDKPANTMWAASSSVVSVTPTHLFHWIDLTPGESGGPVWLLGANQLRLIVGVQSGHWAGGQQPNCSTRITCDVIRRILQWCREFRVRPPRVEGLTRCP